MKIPFVRAICLYFAALLAIKAAEPSASTHAPVLLISMDGFRWDYMAQHPNETVHLRALAAAGVKAEGLIPVFPSNTFPNHYAIVTGLYPSHNGMLNNRMFDAAMGEAFVYNQPRFAHDSRWWGGEPIWITAVKQGRKSACSFWAGSEAQIQGAFASYWKPYNYTVPFESRLAELIDWLKLPAPQRPSVIAFYLEETNSVGHAYGPDSPEIAATLKLLDDHIAAIQSRLAAEHIEVNWVIVSDHGMTPCSVAHVVILDDFVPLTSVQVDFEETVCGLRPTPKSDVPQLLRALEHMPHAKVYRAEDLPARLHIDPHNPRTPPIWILPDEGWHVEREALYNATKPIFPKGQHGYDPALPSMHGIFIASGPAFRQGVTIPEFENVHIYNLLCAAADLKPAPNDGDDRLVKAAMR